MSGVWPCERPRLWTESVVRSLWGADFAAFDAIRLPPGVALVKGERAGVRVERGGAAGGGPTGAPWIDSNGWLIRLTRFRNPGAVVWVRSEPLPDEELVPVESYLVAMADAAAFGGRWVLAPDARMARALAARNRRALGEWQRLATAARFFRQQDVTTAREPAANLGIVSDFAGDNEALTHEILNLSERRHIAYRLVDKARVTPAALAGLRAVLYTDAQPPSAGLRKVLEGFAAAGGLLITGIGWGLVEGGPVPGEPHPRFQVHRFGRGRIALGREMDDPFVVASDAQVLLSHRHDIVRFWNASVYLARVTGPSDQSRLTVQLVNYTGEPVHSTVSMRVAGEFHTARWNSFELDRPRPLELAPQKGGVELQLPAFRVYAAIELG